MCKGKYSIFDVAKWFLQKESMTHKRLQKLCYYAYAWDIAIGEGALLKDCEFEAWVHGPVNRQLWNCFPQSGIREIKLEELASYSDITDVDDADFLETVWNTYGHLGGNALEALTHSEDPWKAARIGISSRGLSDIPLDEDIIKKFYRSIYSGNENGNEDAVE